MTEAEFRNLRRRGKVYSQGVVTLSGGVARFNTESGSRSRWLRRRKPVVILEPIIPTTPIISDPPNLTIGESTFNLKDPSAFGRLLEAAYEPQVEERRRRRARVQEATSSVSTFLLARGEALTKMLVLVSEPRRTLAESIGDAPVSDPLEAYRVKVSREFKEAYESAASGIDSLRVELGAEGVRGVYAAIYAAGRAQDAIFSGDEVLFADAVTLAGRAIGKTLQGDKLRHLSIPRLTDALCVEIGDAMLRFFDEAK